MGTSAIALLGLAWAGAEPPPGIALGVGTGFGALFVEGVVGMEADLATVEIRRFPGQSRRSLDAELDVEQLVNTLLNSPSPRLGLLLVDHQRVPVGGRWSLALAPGIETEWGWDTRVEHETLVRVPGGGLALGGRLGFDHLGRSKLNELGLYARGGYGFHTTQLASEARVRLLFEVTWTRRVGE